MTRLLVVSIAPGLTITDHAKAWVRGELQRRLSTLATKDVVVAGDEDGWAMDAAKPRDRGIVHVELTVRGTRIENGTVVADWCPADDIDFTAPEHRGKRRNETFLEYAGRARAAGWDAGLLVIRGPGQPHDLGDHLVLSNTMGPGLPVHETVYEPPPPPGLLDVVWIDLETGGTSQFKNPIIEIGAVRSDYSCRKVIAHYEAKLAIPPGMWVESEAAKVNGYTRTLWQNAAEASVVLAEFAAWLPAQFVPAGYNFKGFDARFLIYNFEKYGVKEPGWRFDKLIDPMPRIKSLKKHHGDMENARLTTACEHFGISNDVTHRALADAERSRLLYLKILDKEPESSIFQTG